MTDLGGLKLKHLCLLKILCKIELNSFASSKHYYNVFPFLIFPSVSGKNNTATAGDFVFWNPSFYYSIDFSFNFVYHLDTRYKIQFVKNWCH